MSEINQRERETDREREKEGERHTERERDRQRERERESKRQNTLPQTAEYTFFLSAYRTFSRIDLMLGHKTSLSKFNIEIISSIFSAHNTMRLDNNYRKKTVKNTKKWRLNNM